MPTVDTLNLARSCVALVSFASLGVVALPWTEEELEASEGAWRTLFSLPRYARAASGTALAALLTAPNARPVHTGRRAAAR